MNLMGFSAAIEIIIMKTIKPNEMLIIVSDKGRMQNHIHIIIRFCTTDIYEVLNSVSSTVIGPGVTETHRGLPLVLRSSV